MLEEALRNEKHNPSETAAAMLAYVQLELTAGGAAAEARFYTKLFGPLCERIFGPILGEKDDYRHQDGGWLSAQRRWSSTTTSGSTGSSSSSSTRQGPTGMGRQLSSWETDPVVRLLATCGKSYNNNNKEPLLPPTLTEAISTETENRPGVGFSFPFHALPTATQEAWMAVIDMALGVGVGVGGAQSTAPGHGPTNSTGSSTSSTQVVVSENDYRLLNDLLRKRPLEQRALLLYRQREAKKKERVLHQQLYSNSSTPGVGSSTNTSTTSSSTARQLSPRAFASPVHQNYQAKWNTNPASMLKRSSSSFEEDTQPPQVILSMLEYYLFVFLRYPLAMPLPKEASSSSSTPAGGVRTGYNRSSSSLTTATPFGGEVYLYLFRRYLHHFLPYEQQQHSDDLLFDHPSLVFSSELFLRITIAFWMESQARVVATDQVVQALRERRRRAGQQDQNQQQPLQLLALDLNASYDLIQAQYEPPTVLLKKCMRKFIVYAICDPQLRTSVGVVLGARSSSSSSSSIGVQAQQQCVGGSNTNNSSGSGPQRLRLCLSKTMTALQPPFYNYIRTTFRYASIHATSSPFLFALDLWLLWLEPWNLTKSTQMITSIGGGGGQQQSYNGVSLILPKYNHASKYDAAWEPYIAANVYLYAVPLAIFLRRARELDFSAGKFESSIRIVKRVFRVFSPDVMDAVERHLATASNSSSVGIGPTAASSSQWSLPVVRQHLANLGRFAPPPGPLFLSSCQSDMHGLLEEISMQHMKKVRDLDVFMRGAAWLEGLFGKGVVSGEEKELEGLIERAKLIVRLPFDFEIFPGGAPHQPGASATNLAGENLPAFRTSDGMLTQSGRDNVVRGLTKCRRADVSYRGDRMRAVVGGHEIPFLVPFLIWVSDWLNDKLGLAKGASFEQDHSSWVRFRINLRFLADYRHLLFLFFCCFFLKFCFGGR